MSDPINQPAHYTSGNIECIDAIASALGNEGFTAFLRGQVMKYTWRLGMKDSPTQDAAKAEWYARKLRDVVGEVASASDEADVPTPAPSAKLVEMMSRSTPDPYGPPIAHKPGDPCPYPDEVGLVDRHNLGWSDSYRLGNWNWMAGDRLELGTITAYRLRADHPHYKTAADPVRVEAERLASEYHRTEGTFIDTIETAIRRGMEMAQPVPPTEDQLRELLAGMWGSLGWASSSEEVRAGEVKPIGKAPLDHLRKHVAAIREPKQ